MAAIDNPVFIVNETNVMFSARKIIKYYVLETCNVHIVQESPTIEMGAFFLDFNRW